MKKNIVLMSLAAMTLGVGALANINAKRVEVKALEPRFLGNDYADVIDEVRNSLAVTYTDDAGDIDVSNVGLRFGNKVLKADYDGMVKDGFTLKMAVMASSKVDPAWDSEDFVENATVVDMAPETVNEAGEVDEEGEYTQFALVIDDIPEENWDTKFSALIFTVGETFTEYSPLKEASVRSVSDAYLTEIAKGTEEYAFLGEHYGALKYMFDNGSGIDNSKFINTYGTINDLSGDYDFGWFQYGGDGGTSTSVEKIQDTTKSKEVNGDARKVCISGEGNTSGRLYSLYFKVYNNVAALNLGTPKAVSFWVYNEVKGGGLAFKFGGVETTTGIRAFDEDGKLVNVNNRDLDFTGFRRYVISMDSTQASAAELEIAIWGASTNTVVNYSNFSFEYDDCEKISLGNTSALSFTNYADKGSMTKEVVENADYTIDANNKSLKLARTADGFTISSVYLQQSGLYTNYNPLMMLVTVYNTTVIEGGLLFKFSGAEINPIALTRDLNYVGFRTYALEMNATYAAAAEFQIGIWGSDNAEIYISGLTIVNV